MTAKETYLWLESVCNGLNQIEVPEKMNYIQKIKLKNVVMAITKRIDSIYDKVQVQILPEAEWDS